MLKSISNYLVKFFAVIRNILAAICNLMLKCIGCVLVVLLHIGKAVANIIISSYLIVLMFVTLISVGVVVFALESWIISSIAASNGVVDNVIKPVTFVITLIGCCAAIYNFFKKIGNEELNPLLKKMYALSCELNKKAPKKVDELYAEIIVDINKTCNENVISKFNGFKTLRSRKAKKELVDELIISVTDQYRKKIDLTYLISDIGNRTFRSTCIHVNAWFDEKISEVKIAAKINN